MIPRRLSTVFLLIVAISSVKAVETVTPTNSYYNTSNNISSSISSWTNANSWGTGNTNTGWDYVGQVSDASGVYLGNGWVITAAHVNSPTTFTLNGNVFTNTGVYYSNFTNSATGTTNADITLFKISTISTTGTNIPLTYNLTITPATPGIGKTVVMIGYGGPSGQGSESWGTNTIAFNNVYPVAVNDRESIDFVSPNSGANYGTLVVGDSGGADFIKQGTWQLAGINEAVSSSYSYFIQLSSYATQINALVAVPEPGTCALFGLGLGALALSLSRRRHRS